MIESNNPSRMTIFRFAKEVGIPVEELDLELVKVFVGKNRDLKDSYNFLKRNKLLVETAKNSGLSFRDMLTLAEIPKSKHPNFYK